MKPNIIKLDNRWWIHDHGKVFMRVHSLDICPANTPKLKNLKTKLRKLKIRHRIVDQEYRDEDAGMDILYWDFYIEMPYCHLPSRFPKSLTSITCPESSCPSNCAINGIAALQHGKDGRGRPIPNVSSINDILFNRSIPYSPNHVNCRCTTPDYMDTDSIMVPIVPGSVDTIEIDLRRRQLVNEEPSIGTDMYMPSSPPARPGDYQHSMIDESQQICYLYGCITNPHIGNGLVWSRLTYDNISNLRPQAMQDAFRSLAGFDIESVTMNREMVRGPDTLTFEFEGRNGTMKALISPDGIVAVQERTHTAQMPRMPRQSLGDLFG